MPTVGVFVSQHCASHNDGCAEGKVAGQISPGDQIFDRPIRVSRLLADLALLEPEPEAFAAEAAAGAAGSALRESLAVVHSARLAEDRELTSCGVTSRKYLQFLKQNSRELQKKQAVADKWQDQQSAGGGTAAAAGLDQSVEAASSGSGSAEWAYLDADDTTLVNATTEAAARSGVGATLDAVEAVLDGTWAHAFVAGRPPGHHNGCCELLEEIDPGGYTYACHGGCVLNETAIAIRHAQALVAAKLHKQPQPQPAKKKKAGSKQKKKQPVATEPFGSGCKIAVVDIDVHFGDGTALNFYDDPSVLHVSVHLDQSDNKQFPFLVGKAQE